MFSNEAAHAQLGFQGPCAVANVLDEASVHAGVARLRAARGLRRKKTSDGSGSSPDHSDLPPSSGSGGSGGGHSGQKTPPSDHSLGDSFNSSSEPSGKEHAPRKDASAPASRDSQSGSGSSKQHPSSSSSEENDDPDHCNVVKHPIRTSSAEGPYTGPCPTSQYIPIPRAMDEVALFLAGDKDAPRKICEARDQAARDHARMLKLVRRFAPRTNVPLQHATERWSQLRASDAGEMNVQDLPDQIKRAERLTKRDWFGGISRRFV